MENGYFITGKIMKKSGNNTYINIMELFSFKEFIRLQELGMPPPLNPQVANNLRSKIKTLAMTPAGKDLDADDLVNVAAKSMAVAPNTNPLIISKLGKNANMSTYATAPQKTMFGTSKMMNKKMKKK